MPVNSPIDDKSCAGDGAIATTGRQIPRHQRHFKGAGHIKDVDLFGWD